MILPRIIIEIRMALFPHPTDWRTRRPRLGDALDARIHTSQLNMNLPTSCVRGLPVTSRIVFWFVVVTLLGIWPALTNGQPFFYSDTPAYVRGTDLRNIESAGQSVCDRLGERSAKNH
jgi:hypothetical protein